MTPENENFLVPAAEWARRFDLTEQAVIYRLRSGILDGTQKGESWFVLDSAALRAHQRRLAQVQKEAERQQVIQAESVKVQAPGELFGWVLVLLGVLSLVSWVIEPFEPGVPWSAWLLLLSGFALVVMIRLTSVIYSDSGVRVIYALTWRGREVWQRQIQYLRWDEVFMISKWENPLALWKSGRTQVIVIHPKPGLKKFPLTLNMDGEYSWEGLRKCLNHVDSGLVIDSEVMRRLEKAA